MLNKLKNKPRWYQVWAVTVGIGALYYLVRLFFFEPNSLDRFIQVYALGSILLDYFLFPKDKNGER